jgi:hypothetical protein
LIEIKRRKRKVDRLLANQSLLLGGYTVSSSNIPFALPVLFPVIAYALPLNTLGKGKEQTGKAKGKLEE